MSLAALVEAAAVAAEGFVGLVESLETPDDIEAAAGDVQITINAALVEARILGAAGARLQAALVTMADRVVALARVALTQTGELVSLELEADKSVFRLAADLYGTTARWQEIVELNGIRFPNWLTAGTKLRAYRE